MQPGRITEHLCAGAAGVASLLPQLIAELKLTPPICHVGSHVPCKSHAELCCQQWKAAQHRDRRVRQADTSDQDCCGHIGEVEKTCVLPGLRKIPLKLRCRECRMGGGEKVPPLQNPQRSGWMDGEALGLPWIPWIRESRLNLVPIFSGWVGSLA